MIDIDCQRRGTIWKLIFFNFARIINLSTTSDEYQLAVLRYNMSDDFRRISLTLSFNEDERAEPLTAMKKIEEFRVGYSRQLISQSLFRFNGEFINFAIDTSTCASGNDDPQNEIAAFMNDGQRIEEVNLVLQAEAITNNLIPQEAVGVLPTGRLESSCP